VALVVRIRRTPLRLLPLALLFARSVAGLLRRLRLLPLAPLGLLGVCHVHVLLSRRVARGGRGRTRLQRACRSYLRSSGARSRSIALHASFAASAVVQSPARSL
jgi:hypothetical protein